MCTVHTVYMYYKTIEDALEFTLGKEYLKCTQSSRDFVLSVVYCLPVYLAKYQDLIIVIILFHSILSLLFFSFITVQLNIN